uniref:Probable serine/threonine-protein kinase DDB_G0267686 n=1 Tax=Dermatophagoides pteronyssinus TaxID=6956 RepID=A0A6P6Y3J0_DERPT|nr:probable serine/threonine-protein kinase DDB_G0267686 [Dermatophagoides pteronyssinus]
MMVNPKISSSNQSQQQQQQSKWPPKRLQKQHSYHVTTSSTTNDPSSTIIQRLLDKIENLESDLNRIKQERDQLYSENERLCFHLQMINEADKHQQRSINARKQQQQQQLQKQHSISGYIFNDNVNNGDDDYQSTPTNGILHKRRPLMVTKTLATTTTTTKAANLFDNDDGDGGQLESSSMVVDNGGECQCINSYGQIPYSRVPVISCGDQSVCNLTNQISNTQLVINPNNNNPNHHNDNPNQMMMIRAATTKTNFACSSSSSSLSNVRRNSSKIIAINDNNNDNLNCCHQLINNNKDNLISKQQNYFPNDDDQTILTIAKPILISNDTMDSNNQQQQQQQQQFFYQQKSNLSSPTIIGMVNVTTPTTTTTTTNLIRTQRIAGGSQTSLSSNHSQINIGSGCSQNINDNNNKLSTTSTSSSQYELSQQLLDKKVSALERKYGGLCAREAAIKIQRSYRSYRLQKRFTLLAIQAIHLQQQQQQLKQQKQQENNNVIINNNNNNNNGHQHHSHHNIQQQQPQQKFLNQKLSQNQLQQQQQPNNIITDKIRNNAGGGSIITTTKQLSIDLNRGQQQQLSTFLPTQLPPSSLSSTTVQHQQQQQNYHNKSHVGGVGNNVLFSNQIHYMNNNNDNNSSSLSTSESLLNVVGGHHNNHHYHQNNHQHPNNVLIMNNNVTNNPTTTATTTTNIGTNADIYRKRLYRVGLNLFNKTPSDRGISFLIANNFIEQFSNNVEEQARSVAIFLLTRKGVSKQMIGEYLADNNQFNKLVLKAFIAEINLNGLIVDEALRSFQMNFRFPGEAQKIERLVESFADRYKECNPNDVLSRDSIFILAFAIIMLNTDLHKPTNIKHRMTQEQWLSNLKGVFSEGDLSSQFLLGIYKRIKKQELQTGPDHVTQVLKVQSTIVGKDVPNLCLPHRRLVCYCRLYEIRDVNRKEKVGQHQRDVFLFNDLLLITKTTNRSRNNQLAEYQYRSSTSLDGLQVNIFGKGFYAHGIRISRRVDQKCLALFNARNELDQRRFVEDLRESIAEMDEMEQIRITKSSSLVQLNDFMLTSSNNNTVVPVSPSINGNGNDGQYNNCNRKQSISISSSSNLHSSNDNLGNLTTTSGTSICGTITDNDNNDYHHESSIGSNGHSLIQQQQQQHYYHHS